MFVKRNVVLACIVTVLLSSLGCASSSRTDGASGTPGGRPVESRDGSFTGEMVGTPARDSKFAKLQIGMDTGETQIIMGQVPDRQHSYESGKRWIPFYFGNDARRMQVLYKGEGCLIFTGGNI